jgi:hypothetical protein
MSATAAVEWSGAEDRAAGRITWGVIRLGGR